MKNIVSAIALAFLSSGVAFGQTQANSSVQTSEAAAPAALPWTFNMKLNVDGSRFNAMDGADGNGAGINAKNAFRLGYKIDKKWAVEAVPSIVYRTSNPKRSEAFEVLDPYLAVKRSDIFGTKSRGYDLYAEGRYYVPVSAETKREIGTVKDKGKGQALGRLIYNHSLVDGWVNAMVEYDYRRNFSERLAPKKGVTDVHEFYGWLQVPVTEATTPYVSYKNIVNRYNSGLGDPWVKNHTVGVGARWQPVKSFYLDPSIDSPFMLKDTTVKLEAVYYFI